MKKTIQQIFCLLACCAIGLVVFNILFPNIGTRSAAREETVQFFRALETGLATNQVQDRFQSFHFKHLTLVKASGTLWVVQTPFETGAVNWQMYMDFNKGKLFAFRIRTADSKADHPRDAPQDTVGPTSGTAAAETPRPAPK